MISGCFALPQRSSDCFPADGRPLPRAQNFIRFASSNLPVQDLRISPIHIPITCKVECCSDNGQLQEQDRKTTGESF